VPIVNPPGYVQSGSYTAQNDRLHHVSARYQPSRTQSFALAARGGFFTGNSRDASYIIDNGGVGWSLVVGPLTCVVENNFGTNAGDYLVIKNSNDFLTLTPSSPTTSRVDTIAIQVVDAFYSGAVTEGRLVVVQGTPTTGTPAAPTLPPTALPIFDAVVNAGSTAPTLVDRRRRTGLLNSIVPIFGDQFTDAGTYAGEANYYDITGTVRVWRAGSINAWRVVGGTIARNGSQLRTTAALNDGQESNQAQVILNDPGGIFAAQATMQTEFTWTNGGRCDLTVTLNGMNNGTIFGTAMPVTGVHPVTFGQLSAALSGPLSGLQTVWFNIIRTFGGPTTYTSTPFNFRASAVQVLLRAT
jgi:hypothetical protein